MKIDSTLPPGSSRIHSRGSVCVSCEQVARNAAAGDRLHKVCRSTDRGWPAAQQAVGGSLQQQCCARSLLVKAGTHEGGACSMVPAGGGEGCSTVASTA
jgi:hypothetical protein